MAVDNRWNLYYDPEQISEFTPEQIMAALLHESWHLLGLHHERLVAYPPRIASYGGDCAINSSARSIGLELPKGLIYPELFGLPDGKSAEFYCEHIMQNAVTVTISIALPSSDDRQESRQQQRGSGSGNQSGQNQSGQQSGQNQSGQNQSGQNQSGQNQSGQGQSGGQGSQVGDIPDGFGGLLVPNHGSCAHGRRESYEVDGEGLPESVQRSIIKQVARDIKSCGDAPEWMQRWADSVLEPQVNWANVLRRMLGDSVAQCSGMVDYTWRRPSRRQALMDGVILPRLQAPMPNVAVLVDTSGSMSDEELGIALSEIRAISRTVGELMVYTADTEIKTARSIFNPEQVHRIELLGGGGTSMRNATEQLLHQYRKRPLVLVIITDGYTDWPDRHDQVQMIGVLTTDHDVPSHIRTLRIERREQQESPI
jgi:predicted metal-dependent peptidase